MGHFNWNSKHFVRNGITKPAARATNLDFLLMGNVPFSICDSSVGTLERRERMDIAGDGLKIV